MVRVIMRKDVLVHNVQIRLWGQAESIIYSKELEFAHWLAKGYQAILNPLIRTMDVMIVMIGTLRLDCHLTHLR